MLVNKQRPLSSRDSGLWLPMDHYLAFIYFRKDTKDPGGPAPGLSVRVLALSAYDSDRYLAEMWEADACGYLLKEEPLERIAAIIQQVARSEPLWTTAQVQRIQRYREIAAR